MLDAIVAVLVGAATLGVLVPLGLAYLLARQVLPVRPGATVLVVLAGLVTLNPVLAAGAVALATWLQLDGRRRSQRRPPAQEQPGTADLTALTGRWRAAVADALAAQRRFATAVDTAAGGPLRDELRELSRAVDESVQQARHLALSGQRAARARGEVEAALRRSRRRSRGVAHDTGCDEALRLQRASTARLAACAARDATALDKVVAGLDAAAATALELSATGDGPQAVEALADRVAALRAGALEVARLPVG